MVFCIQKLLINGAIYFCEMQWNVDVNSQDDRKERDLGKYCYDGYDNDNDNFSFFTFTVFSFNFRKNCGTAYLARYQIRCGILFLSGCCIFFYGFDFKNIEELLINKNIQKYVFHNFNNALNVAIFDVAWWIRNVSVDIFNMIRSIVKTHNYSTESIYFFLN